MNEGARRLRALPARPLWQLLEALQSASLEEVRRDELVAPRVTLLLRSGRTILGRVSALREIGDGSMVLMHTGGDDRWDVGSDATYVPFDAIEGIVVHEATSHIELLAGGAVPTHGSGDR
ncbi:MAG: hypothetical protein H7Z43_06390 [Clostridia bacterium]|nr:hypothetical protein [Deltaproteobacteria bacterium]